ncbi:hypothetical protein [Streptomyces sp. WMMB 322]|uniref:hypothetical protein n=1 Tax=Streptomyces sp. WMMB 322 TaxID=1286821 RepID=UPI0009439C27|nr:hypothetical protein [Streptomyces sp. WMMB 322]
MTDRTRGALRAPEARLPIGLGLFLVVVSAVLFAMVPGALANARAYATAPTCPAGTRSDSCTASVPATVEGTESKPVGKGHEYWLLVTERGSDDVHRVKMAGHDPVYEAVHAGDHVVLDYWRGEIRAVSSGDAVQETDASPTDGWRLPTGFGLLTLPFGLGMLAAGLWYRFRYLARRRVAPWQITVPTLTGVLLGCLGLLAGWAGGGVLEAFTVTAAGIPPAVGLATLVAWWVTRREVRAADTGGIVPVPPKGKQCVHAAVHGDVPYSVDGFGLLVVGDGRPAATPDPDGSFARRSLPESLTVRELRPLRPEDPVGWANSYKYDAVVLECRDGDRRVRVVTRRVDAPVVLGALTDPLTGPTTAPGDGGHRPSRTPRADGP